MLARIYLELILAAESDQGPGPDKLDGMQLLLRLMDELDDAVAGLFGLAGRNETRARGAGDIENMEPSISSGERGDGRTFSEYLEEHLTRRSRRLFV